MFVRLFIYTFYLFSSEADYFKPLILEPYSAILAATAEAGSEIQRESQKPLVLNYWRESKKIVGKFINPYNMSNCDIPDLCRNLFKESKWILVLLSQTFTLSLVTLLTSSHRCNFSVKVWSISGFAFSNSLVERICYSCYNRSFTLLSFSFHFETGEQAKNDHASTIINRILDQSGWINIHMLPVSLFICLNLQTETIPL